MLCGGAPPPYHRWSVPVFDHTLNCVDVDAPPPAAPDFPHLRPFKGALAMDRRFVWICLYRAFFFSPLVFVCVMSILNLVFFLSLFLVKFLACLRGRCKAQQYRRGFLVYKLGVVKGRLLCFVLYSRISRGVRTDWLASGRQHRHPNVV